MLDHLIHSGVVPAHAKEEIFLSKKTNKSLDLSIDSDLYQLLTRTDLFRKLQADEFNSLLEKMDKINLKQGDSLFKQEDVADSMFVCIEGLLSSDVDGIEVGQIKANSIRAGQHFGEGALLGGQWREYSVSAETDALLYEIRRRDFDPIIARHREIEKYLEQTHKESTERAKLAVENAKALAKEEPKKKKQTAMNKVMRLWPKKKTPKQSFFEGM